jgi:hypothetical protein
VECDVGQHYLDGQLDFMDNETLVGFSQPMPAQKPL